MLTTKFSRPLFISAMMALSLSQMPSAHAAGFVAKVRGAFAATGDAIKDTARATGNVIAGGARVTGGVIKESAIVTEDVFKGTAKAGEAACAATGDVIKGSAKATGTACAATGRAIGTTTGAIAGVTGDAITGSARAVGNTAGAAAGAVSGATEGVLGVHSKTAETPALKPANDTIPAPVQAQQPAPTKQLPVAKPQPAPKVAKVHPPKPERPQHENAAADSDNFPQEISAAKLKADKMRVDLQQGPIENFPISTEGTRISAPSENESPSWNDQAPTAQSTAFASQYALRTTPLKAGSN